MLRLYHNLIEVFVIADDFCIASENSSLSKELPLYNGKRGFKKKLAVSEGISLNIMRFLMGWRSLKEFCVNAKDIFEDYFDFPTYENFLKASFDSIPYLHVFLLFLMRCNQNKSKKVYYGDETAIEV